MSDVRCQEKQRQLAAGSGQFAGRTVESGTWNVKE